MEPADPRFEDGSPIEVTRLEKGPRFIRAIVENDRPPHAVAAVAHGLDAAILFRRPNSASANRIIEEIRAVKMGTLIPAGRDAPFLPRPPS